MAKAAGQMAHKAVRQIQKPAGNTRVVHNGTRRDEERDRQVRRSFGNGHHALHRDLNGHS